MRYLTKIFLIILVIFYQCSIVLAKEANPLLLWNNGKVKKNIISFVKNVTNPNNKFFVEKKDRIAVFDNDGTLICEKPQYIHFVCIANDIYHKSKNNPALQTIQPYKAILTKNFNYFYKFNDKKIYEILLKPYEGMTQKNFISIFTKYFNTHKHPRFKVSYIDLVYEPMIELLGYLHSFDFKIFIVSGNITDFVRTFSYEKYNILPENVIGNSVLLKFEIENDRPVFVRTDTMVLPTNNEDGKPINIQLRIGKKPIISAGNSNGDIPMLELSQSPNKKSLQLVVKHDDAKREYKYNTKLKILKIAKKKNWQIISMRNDFKKIFSK